MAKLIVIADDFTGALDTGVQFAGAGTLVAVMPGEQLSQENKADVLVLDAEARHLTPKAAYEKVYRLVQTAKTICQGPIYIKTDSGLRGNIGAMMAAALDATCCGFAAYAPAFPAMGRVTSGGVQYVDDVPIDESPFGTDPFEPVRAHFVRDLFSGWECKVRDYPLADSYCTIVQNPTVGIFDVKENADFKRIIVHLKKGDQLQVLGGCAGFAAALARALQLGGVQNKIPASGQKLLVICGSLNPITRSQMEQGVRAGYTRISLTAKQLLSESPADGEDGSGWMFRLNSCLHRGESLLIDTASEPETEEASICAQAGISENHIREAIARALGKLMKFMLERDKEEKYLPMIIGGDTLQGFIEQLGDQVINPICEVVPGAVMFTVRISDSEKRLMISKSGGFGTPDMLIEIEHALKEGVVNGKLRA